MKAGTSILPLQSTGNTSKSPPGDNSEENAFHVTTQFLQEQEFIIQHSSGRRWRGHAWKENPVAGWPIFRSLHRARRIRGQIRVLPPVCSSDGAAAGCLLTSERLRHPSHCFQVQLECILCGAYVKESAHLIFSLATL